MADTVYYEPRLQSASLSKVPYLPGLDGMRALAVVAVMIYHASSDWLSGGFLGVEVFFVISGYLITLLLMEESSAPAGSTSPASGSVAPADCCRRCSPCCSCCSRTRGCSKPDTLGKLRGDMLGGLFYVMNWYQIWVGQGYSAAGDFAPLRHLWSLAVEEQFYLLWPLVMLVLLRRNGTRSLAKTARWLVLGAPGRHRADGGAVPARSDPGMQHQSRRVLDGRRAVHLEADTLYLSTITRAGGLLLGAAFAMIWRPVAIMRGPLRDAGRLLDIVAVVGLGLLAFFCWRLAFITPDGADPWLFRGGFLWTSIATLMVIAAVAHRRTVIGRLLGARPLLWVGTRSYGLYLYHCRSTRSFARSPATRSRAWSSSWRWRSPCRSPSCRTGSSKPPIRKRRVTAWWRGLNYRSDPGPRQFARMGAVFVILVAAFGVLRLGLAELKQNEIAQALEETRLGGVGRRPDQPGRRRR